MTTVYFITNNYILENDVNYQRKIPEEKKKELVPLSILGEKIANRLSKDKNLSNTSEIYTSSETALIDTAKYLAESLNLSIQVEERLKERKVGIVGNHNEIFLKETQEHDFEYKFQHGESMQNAQDRMKEVLKDILFRHENETITVFTHDLALESLFSIWCEKGYNLENHLILNYKEDVVMDGAFHPHRVFRLIFDGMTLKELTWINKEE